ncbi:hypothetical protein NBM05_01965 [Rothia sp. AR01]|uniref:Exonuclease VII large subunit C-terminal domain-containing protein n=1 Tax=Rothia santali TaxID=2949643 RepID=A0A9X2HIC7_9MICC|nr:exodeoxyribonuclease VII large subunit [Rothia santali]MCP3424828.1 hypothetical protein [Rothia santali]
MTEAPLDHEISSFQGRHALMNSLVVGVYLKMLALGEERLADAWLDSGVELVPGEMALRTWGAYSRTPRPVLRMLMRPLSKRAHLALNKRIDFVREVVREFSSSVDGVLELEAVVWAEIGDVIQPSTEDRVNDIKDALAACGEEGQTLIEELDLLLPQLIFGWGAYASQRVQHVAVRDGDQQTVARVTKLLKSLSDFLWGHDKIQLATGEMNNISFASTAPGPRLILDAASSRALPRKKWRVGVIVPGGEAARSDIAELEEHPELECSLRTVYRNKTNFAAQMSSALAAFKFDQDAIVVAYGGGSKKDLEKVHAALEPHLETLEVPCWVAVGHASDPMTVKNPVVRVCRTPSDARTLFLAETVQYEQQLGMILAEGARRLENGEKSLGNGESIERALRNMNNTVSDARGLHLQNGS